jgi:hypothetical protein
MLKYPGKYSDLNIDKEVTHFWALIFNEVIIFKGHYSQSHSSFFGIEVEDISERGYFIASKHTVTCHTFVERWLLTKIEKAFDKAELCALYIYNSFDKV